MKKIIMPASYSLLIVCFLSVFSQISFSQSVGIGTITPDASAQLDITHTAKGILIPRMSTIAVSAISNPAKGLMVYDSVKNQLMVNMGTASSPNWQTIVSNSGWSLAGNISIDSSDNFIGTLSASPLIIRIHNIRAGMIDTASQNTSLGFRTLQSNIGGVSNNAAFGYKALISNDSGINNTAIGSNALRFNKTGHENTATGFVSLQQNTTGNSNTAIGSYALLSNTTGSYNIATGMQSMQLNMTGDSNTAYGSFSLNRNINAAANTAIGMSSLYWNAAGFNTGVGFESLNQNTSGTRNTAVGAVALWNNQNGNDNTAVGDSALYNSTSFYGGNTATGSLSLRSNTGGYYNTANGYLALTLNSDGNSNTADGAHALYSNTTGIGNVAVGDSAGINNVDGNYNTMIGYNADVGSQTYATAIGANAVAARNNLMAFGDGNISYWVFGRSAPGNGTTTALQVGTNSTNGNGAILTKGGAWTNASDMNLKENFLPLENRNILDKINQLSITQWNYKGTHETHIGPMAQQFKQLFNVGMEDDDKTISTIDPSGIALVGIQELTKRVEEQQQAIDSLKKEIQLLKEQNKILLRSVNKKNN